MSHTNFEFSYATCQLCPRRCGVDRTTGVFGVCGMGERIHIGRAAPHFWEEPCLSGTKGSGAVFFTGCSLKCSFCQNWAISRASEDPACDSADNKGQEDLQDFGSTFAAETKNAGRPGAGRVISEDELSDTFLRLQEQGVHNINLVTAAHFAPGVVRALETAKKMGLNIPIVWNSSGYESLETLRILDGLVDIYLPDCKYVSSDLSGRYSSAPDYFEVCSQALSEMVRQTGEPLFTKRTGGFLTAEEYNNLIIQEEEDDYVGPLMVRGTIVRHLALPGGAADSQKVISYLHETFGDRVYLSLMAQYTPMTGASMRRGQSDLKLDRPLRLDEYEALVEYCLESGIENAFLQGLETADESFVPAWDEM